MFDYDRRDNCEAFANLLVGAADLHSDGVQGVLGYTCTLALLLSAALLIASEAASRE